ncbi:glycoside hydrolase family 3 [Colletotrichum higginsianum]|uniref:beta-glucosidase n=1 Tax=Colletotrichum higginsianum (strain IMI 349063) TaxID=759273 RepID=H1UYK0_COLHI|nr:Glycoside hydrolase family 3 [Colletotrichum higginsianum IMI 349063]OBR04003.1 Glycoside hydrolase family 3 [Colletotrichum higginsianum IMI 349063]CCF33051.1 glycoside hydrolase family 3 [Colletotrichum higginsianum]
MRNGILALGALAGITSARFIPRQSNGTEKIPAYRNASLCIDERVDDLLARMTLAEKAGQMFHARTYIGNGTLDNTLDGNLDDQVLEDISERSMTHFVLTGAIDDTRNTAEWYNNLQRHAAETGLGIPITISVDPQHGVTTQTAVSFVAKAFSRWPDPMGVAALRSPELTRKYAEVVREEYMAVGIRQALHPQIDLWTEPRWGRGSAGFSEDAALTSQLGVEWIKGLQGDKLGPRSVVATTKHFPGGGPMENGEDSHFEWGKNQTYPGDNFDHHLIPFKAAIAAGTAQIMPYYSRPIGTQWEEVAFGFNKGIVTNLLKEQLGFEGIVVTDWNIVKQRFWGLEEASEKERTRRVIEAGCDIFGGADGFPDLIVELVEEGAITEERIDYSVRKLMKEKFELGLFDNPYVDVEASVKTVNNPYFARLGRELQRRSLTLLTNDGILPLPPSARSAKFYVEGIPEDVMESYGLAVVGTPQEADYALLRLRSPYKPTSIVGPLGEINNGTIEYNSTEKARQSEIYGAVPTVVDIKFNRPPAVPEIVEQASALLVNYGSTPDAFLDVVFGIDGWAPEGKLPVEVPRSQAAADAQFGDVPFDSVDPLFRFGHGLRYTDACTGGCKNRR